MTVSHEHFTIKHSGSQFQAKLKIPKDVFTVYIFNGKAVKLQF
jgi:hypothetical protein